MKYLRNIILSDNNKNYPSLWNVMRIICLFKSVKSIIAYRPTDIKGLYICCTWGPDGSV